LDRGSHRHRRRHHRRYSCDDFGGRVFDGFFAPPSSATATVLIVVIACKTKLVEFGDQQAVGIAGDTGDEPQVVTVFITDIDRVPVVDRDVYLHRRRLVGIVVIVMVVAMVPAMPVAGMFGRVVALALLGAGCPHHLDGDKTSDAQRQCFEAFHLTTGPVFLPARGWPASHVLMTPKEG
jgi:hypothetical protein